MPRDPITENYFRLHPDTLSLVTEIQKDKYMLPTESSWAQTHARIASAVFKTNPDLSTALEYELNEARACPAGRVLAGAGSDKNVTWWNCFVSPLVQDSMRTDLNRPGLGIMDSLASVAYSMQMGGGVGTDFSPLRPKGALVKRIQAEASGPLAFMDMWDSMCKTVMSAGYRRGAMMATLTCDHPDIMAFITAKHNPTRLRMFNMSVLTTHAFMKAKENDEMWELGHCEPPFDQSNVLAVYQRNDRPWYVYERLPARQIWQTIMESTYKYSEPGTIFIDTINDMNNLYWCENISCTNPCGEQPLPPDANCNLSHNNVSRCIIGTPFTDDCRVDLESIKRVTRLQVDMSDNIIDLSPVPTEAQHLEALAKRRIGLGITGLANMLMFLRQRYGSPVALETCEELMRTIRDESYRESINLAKEKGPFPLFDREKYLKGRFIQTLPEDIREGIAEHGIRNALLNTIAPTGTTSIGQCDNSSTGLEPVFLPRYNRSVLQPDNSFKDYSIEDFGFRVYANVLFDGNMDEALKNLPDYMVTTKDLTPRDHLLTQASLQKYIDSSVSKTINVPPDIDLDSFVSIYDQAYTLGCKGCTTYREVPESGRGSVLSAVKENIIEEVKVTGPRQRPDILEGRTYRLRWGALPYPMFFTINDEILPNGKHIPFEVFVNSKAVDSSHWVSALTRMITAVMRKGGDFSFIPEELMQVWSARGGEFIDKRYVPSEVALLGHTLQRHFREIGYIKEEEKLEIVEVKNELVSGFAEIGPQCHQCGQPTVVRQEGCDRCLSCGWSNCG